MNQINPNEPHYVLSTTDQASNGYFHCAGQGVAPSRYSEEGFSLETIRQHLALSKVVAVEGPSWNTFTGQGRHCDVGGGRGNSYPAETLNCLGLDL